MMSIHHVLMQILMGIYSHLHTCAYTYTLSDTNIPMHRVGIGIYPPTDPCLTHAGLTFTCGHIHQICIHRSPIRKHTNTHIPSLRHRLKACSSLHFPLLTHLHCAISLAGTHVFFCKHIHSAHPLSHTHIQTEPLSVLPFLHLFHFHTHPHSNPSLPPSLPPSVSHTICFLVSHRLGCSACTHRAGNILPDANPPTPSVPAPPTTPPGAALAQEQLLGQRNSLQPRNQAEGQEKPGRACPICQLTPCTLSPSAEDRGHLKPGHLRLCISQNLRWVGLRQHISNFL